MVSSNPVHSDIDEDDTGVELGFVRSLSSEESWRLNRCYFPSKVGGKPAWLDPKNIPDPEVVKCSACKKAMAFLLQIYAPNDDRENTFHRTIYLFCCKTPTCYEHHSSIPFKVLRCQLPRNNEFYDPTPPNYDSPQYSKLCKNFTEVCQLCGFVANKTCSRCLKVSYCCKEHQTIHWKFHKVTCGKDFNNEKGRAATTSFSDFLFPEYEIEMEKEESGAEPSEASSVNNLPNVSSHNFSAVELEQFTSVNPSEKQFAAFRKAKANYPDQILRYDKSGTPLWCSCENVLLQNEVPDCACGARRVFEFQVMPQLLSHMDIQDSINEPSVDWGILAVYTCSADCRPVDRHYQTEYLHKQDFEITEQMT